MISRIDRYGRVFVMHNIYDFHILNVDEIGIRLARNYFLFIQDNHNGSRASLDMLMLALTFLSSIHSYECDYDKTKLSLSIRPNIERRFEEYVHIDDGREFKRLLGTIRNDGNMPRLFPDYLTWYYRSTNESERSVYYFAFMIETLIALRNKWLA